MSFFSYFVDYYQHFEKDTITGNAEMFSQILGVNVILSAKLGAL